MHLSLSTDSTVPLVKQLEEQLRRQICSGQIKPGEKLPSMRKLAEQLDVSVIITKQALNTLTTQGYLKAIPKAGVFVEETIPIKNIALILPTVEVEQIPRMVRSAREALPKHYHLVIEASAHGYEGQVEILRDIPRGNIAGAILSTPTDHKFGPLLQNAIGKNFPCIQTIFELDDLLLDSVTADGFAMGQMTVDYLINKGHRKIGLINSPSDARTFRDRAEGMDASLRKIGQTFASLPSETCRLDLSIDPALRATEKLLEKHPDLTAIIGGNGQLTLGVARAINQRNRRIPEDISVIAMELDLSPFEYTTPQITAVDKPMERIMSRAVEMLINRIESPDAPIRSVHYAPTLVERQSVRAIS